MKMGEAALVYAFNRAEWGSFKHVVIVFSSVFYRKKRGILKQTFKALIKQKAKKAFALYFHESKFDLCNQAVDYLGWAVYRKWENDDLRSYNSVRHMVQSEFNIFEKGKIEYYTYKQ